MTVIYRFLTIRIAQTGKAECIADLLKREVKNGIFKFVFLNGCSTSVQVQGLKNVGISSIIATNNTINDTEAIQFSNKFYRTWAKSDDTATAFDEPLTNIRQAFEVAIAYLKTLYTVTIKDQTGGFIFEVEVLFTFTNIFNLLLKFALEKLFGGLIYSLTKSK